MRFLRLRPSALEARTTSCLCLRVRQVIVITRCSPVDVEPRHVPIMTRYPRHARPPHPRRRASVLLTHALCRLSARSACTPTQVWTRPKRGRAVKFTPADVDAARYISWPFHAIAAGAVDGMAGNQERASLPRISRAQRSYHLFPRVVRPAGRALVVRFGCP